MVVVNAQQAAVNLNHGQIDTEHELLGLLADPDGIPSRVLNSHGVTAARVRERVIDLVGRGEAPVQGQIPFTPAAKKVLEMSLREALNHRTRTVTPEHLLIALVGVSEGVAVQILLDLGADPTAIRDELERVLPRPVPGRPRVPAAFQPQPVLTSGDPTVRRVLEAASEYAALAQRAEFDVLDLLDALASDRQAAGVIAGLGIDVKTMRDAIAGNREPGGVADRFTDAAAAVVDLAHQEARALGHTWIGVEHLLLGLLPELTSIAAQALESLGVSLEAVRAGIVARVPAPRPDDPIKYPPGSSAPFTPRAKRALERSLREALALGQTPRAIGPEHILLSITQDDRGLAIAILRDLGIEPAKLRATVLELIPDSRPAPGKPNPPAEPPPPTDAPR